VLQPLASLAWYPLAHIPIPPAPAIFDQRVIDLRVIGQEHLSKGAHVLVEAVGLEVTSFPKTSSDLDGLAHHEAHCA